MDAGSCYLIAINVAGFLFYVVNMFLYTYTKDGQIDILLTIVALLGGALGIVLAILIVNRKAQKENMMSRVFVICVLVVQIVLFYFLAESASRHLLLTLEIFLQQTNLLLSILR